MKFGITLWHIDKHGVLLTERERDTHTHARTLTQGQCQEFYRVMINGFMSFSCCSVEISAFRSVDQDIVWLTVDARLGAAVAQ